MEEKTDLASQFLPKYSGDEASVDSLEHQIPDDKKATADGLQSLYQSEKDKGSSSKVNKKVIKHALRQQAKRRRKNTTIAAGGGASNVPVHRLNSSPHCELEEMTSDTSNYRQPTMAEVLSSIPGFNLRVPSRKRSNKKMSAAAQIEQTREGCVDLESPDSILVNTNLRQLLNRHTFASLPQLYQYKLLQLLPHVDRVPTQTETMYRLSSSALNNEFFARACLDWRERLAEGEFTPENQAKLKAEQEKEKSKLDPWKLKHFEPMWGESLREWPSLPPGTLIGGSTTVAATPTLASPVIGNKKELLRGASLGTPKPPKDKPAQAIPVRTVGAVTRAVTSYREKKAAQESTPKSYSTSSPGKDTKEVTSEKSPDSTAVGFCKEKSREKTVDKKLLPVIMMQCDSEVKVEVAEEIVVTEGTFSVEDDAVQMKDDDHLICDVNEEIVCETGTSTDEMDGTPITALEMTSIPTSSDELIPLPNRKRRSAEVVDSAIDASDPTLQPKRSKSADEESPVLVAPADTIDSSSMVLEVIGNDLTTTEVPEILSDESCLVVAEPQQEVGTTEAVAQTVEVDLPAQTDPVEQVMDDMSRPVPIIELKSLEAAEVRPEVHLLTGTPAPVVLDPMELSPASAVIPATPMTIQRGLQVRVDGNQAEVIGPASDDQDYEVDKTLGDVVALEQEVADRQSNQSVKAEELNKSAAHLEEWEIIKVDPNDTTTEVACSTASDTPIPTSVAAIPGLSAYGNVLYHEDEELKEDEAALLAAAWDVVGSSSEFQHQVNLNQPVSVIPCHEELEVRLQESSLPAPQWEYAPQDSKCQTQGHVKLELEVTLTPEVDSSTVTSTCSGVNGTKLHLISNQMSNKNLLSGNAGQTSELLEQNKNSGDMSANPNMVSSYGVMSPKTPSSCPSPSSSGQMPSLKAQQQLQVVVCSNEGSGVTVIPPTTIVCLPPPSVSNTSSTHPLPPPHHHRPPSASSVSSQGPPLIAQSSPGLPFIALTTSTPVRALVTKSVTKPSSRSGRNNINNNRPPPGAVNLERSYQICQAVIQNSPNRHQLRCQLKPPPALLGKSGVSNAPANRVPSTVNVANRGGGRVGLVQQPIGNAAAPTSRSHVVFRHVFASSAGGIPVSMAVLPSVHHQVSEVMRGLELRRSNSAPPHSAEATRGVRPPSAPPLPPPFATSASQTNNGNSSSNCSCSLKAMIACVMCGAFCHDDCLASPTSRLCVMCCDTR